MPEKSEIYTEFGDILKSKSFEIHPHYLKCSFSIKKPTKMEHRPLIG